MKKNSKKYNIRTKQAVNKLLKIGSKRLSKSEIKLYEEVLKE